MSEGFVVQILPSSWSVIVSLGKALDANCKVLWGVVMVLVKRYECTSSTVSLLLGGCHYHVSQLQ